MAELSFASGESSLSVRRFAVREAMRASEELARHLERLAVRLDGRFPLRADAVGSDDESREQLHAFFHMFEQLYDLIARRLLRGALIMVNEDHRSLSYKAVVRRVEQLVDLDGDAWLAVGETRNKLVHEYATSDAILADQANAAWAALRPLLGAQRRMMAYLEAEGEA